MPTRNLKRRGQSDSGSWHSVLYTIVNTECQTEFNIRQCIILLTYFHLIYNLDSFTLKKLFPRSDAHHLVVESGTNTFLKNK